MAFLFGALAGITFAVVLAAVVWYVATATGRMTIDTGWGRLTRELGPQVVRYEAPRERVFELLAVPYLSERPPRALREKVEVLERGDGMVLAAHRVRRPARRSLPQARAVPQRRWSPHRCSEPYMREPGMAGRRF